MKPSNICDASSALNPAESAAPNRSYDARFAASLSTEYASDQGLTLVHFSAQP
jgi:hypothetical protein